MVLKVRGFPERWITWIQRLLSTSKSRILVNGEETRYIQHKRGLRQGDPISPMLFIIANDVFQKLVTAANSVLTHSLSRNFDEGILAL